MPLLSDLKENGKIAKDRGVGWREREGGRKEESEWDIGLGEGTDVGRRQSVQMLGDGLRV